MQGINTAPAHELLQRKNTVDNHSTRPTQSGAASALSSYSFGPMTTGGKSSSSSAAAGIAGSNALHNPLVKHSSATLTALQSVDPNGTLTEATKS